VVNVDVRPGGARGPARPSRSLLHRTAAMAVSLIAMTSAGTVLQIAVLAYLGHLGGQALYLRSVYLPFGFLTLAVAEGLTVTVQVATAELHRRNRTAEAGGPLLVLGALGLGGFLVLALSTWLVATPLAALLHVPATSRGEVRAFTVAMLIAAGMAMVATLASAALRGLGRVRLSAALAVAETLLICVSMLGAQALWSVGALSVPIGFVAGSLPIAVLGWTAVVRAGVSLRWPAALAGVLHQLRWIALPVAGSFLVLAFSSFGYLCLLRDASADEVAGFGLGQTIQTFLIVPAIAIGSAAAIASTLYGDANRRRSRTGALRTVVSLALPAYLLISTAVVLLRAPLVEALTRSAEVGSVAVDYLGTVGPSLALLGVTLAVLTFLEQTGNASGAFVLNATFFAAVLAMGAALATPLHPHSLTLLIAFANVVGCACVLSCAVAIVRRMGRNTP